MQNASQFEIKIEKPVPLWLELLQYGAMLFIGWAVIHVTLNWNAFAEIVEFKINSAVVAVQQVAKQKEIEGIELGARVDFPGKESQQAALEATKINSENTRMLKDAKRKIFADMPIYPSDNRIVIPRLNKSIPLVSVPNHTDWDALERSMQAALREGVAVHPVSRPPDQNGNFFVTGHSSYYFYDEGRYKDVFALLHEVDDGEKIAVYWGGKKYEYVINGRIVVKPNEVDVLKQPKNKKMLTLMTCTPIGTAKKRLVLTAEPINAPSKKRGIDLH